MQDVGKLVQPQRKYSKRSNHNYNITWIYKAYQITAAISATSATRPVNKGGRLISRRVLVLAKRMNRVYENAQVVSRRQSKQEAVWKVR